MTTDIDILLFDGFDELDAIAPYEVFANAARAGADCAVSLVTHDRQERVTASHGLDVDVDGVLSEPSDDNAPDILLVPGGGWSSGEVRGVRREYDAGNLPDAIAAHHAAGATIASVCTGAMLLERAGVLGDGPAVTHQSAVEDLRAAGVTVPERRVVDDGQVVTAGGVTSGLDLALHLVRREFGERIADEVATVLEYEASEDIFVRRQ
jgi:transcriptional regulator GlxA family with amidase domain